MKLYGTLIENDTQYFTLLTVAENEEQAITNFGNELIKEKIVNSLDNIKWDIAEISEVDGYKISLEKEENK